MSPPSPATLDALRALPPGPARIAAADAYIAARQDAIRAARAVRDADIRDLITDVGPAEAARVAGRSLSTIKLIRGRP